MLLKEGKERKEYKLKSYDLFISFLSNSSSKIDSKMVLLTYKNEREKAIEQINKLEENIFD